MLDSFKKSISPCSVVLTRCDTKMHGKNSRTDLVTLDNNLLPKMKYTSCEVNDTSLQKQWFPSGISCILCKNCDVRIPIENTNCINSSSLCQLCEFNAKASESTNLGDDSNGSEHNLLEITTEQAYLKNKSFTIVKKEAEEQIDFQKDDSPIKVKEEPAPFTIATNEDMANIQSFQIASNNNQTLYNVIKNEGTFCGNEILKESHTAQFIKEEINNTNEGIQIQSFQTIANSNQTFYNDNNKETISWDNETFKESPDTLRSSKIPLGQEEEKPDHDLGHSDSDNEGCKEIDQCDETVPFHEQVPQVHHQLNGLEYPYRRIMTHKRKFATSCQECGEYFTSTELLKKHMGVHSNRKAYETMTVPSMSVGDSDVEILSDHGSGESESDGGYCDDVLQQPETGQILQDDLPKRFSCKECHIAFTYAKTVACHEWVVHGIPHPPTGCRYCKVPPSRSTLHNYLVIHCLECGKYFPSEKLLNEHSVIHTKGKDIDENSSSQPFSSPDGNREKIELLKCISCEELFVNLSEIREHNCGGKVISFQNGKKDRLNLLKNASRISDVRKRNNAVSGLSQDLIEGSSKRIAIEEVSVQPVHDSEPVELLNAGTTKSTINKINVSSTVHINIEPHENMCSNGLADDADVKVGQWSNVVPVISTPTVEFESANYIGTIRPCGVIADSENGVTDPICKISSCTSLVPKQEDFLEDWSLPNHVKSQIPHPENDKPIISAPMVKRSCVKNSNIRNCGLCGLVCNSRSEFLNHTAKFHRQKTNASNHKQIVHIDEDLKPIHRQMNFVCNLCGEKFNVPSALSHHEVTVHMTQELTEAGYEIVMLRP